MRDRSRVRLRPNSSSNSAVLVPLIFVMTLLLTLATALFESSFATARIARDRTAARYADVAVTDAVADFTAGLAAYVKVHGSSGPWPAQPSDSYPKALCGGESISAACPYSYVIHAAITDAANVPAPGMAGEAAVNVQTTIGESRLSASVSATLSGPQGTVVATRTRLLTYRVLSVMPYAFVSGSRDTTTAGGTRTTAQGDTGGLSAPSDSSATDSTGGQPSIDRAAALHDTRIHVQLTCRTAIVDADPKKHNDQQPIGNDDLPWGNAAGAAHEAPCLQPAAPADAFSDTGWTNGNTNASGWTP